MPPIFVRKEDVLTGIASQHDMIDDTGEMKAGLGARNEKKNMPSFYFNY